MEINGWAFACIAVYLIVRNAWKYLLLWRMGGFVKKAKSMIPGGNNDADM